MLVHSVIDGHRTTQFTPNTQITAAGLNLDLNRQAAVDVELRRDLDRAGLAPPGQDPIVLPWGQDLTGKLLLGTAHDVLAPVDPSSLLSAVNPNLPVSAVPSFTLQTLKTLPPMLDGTVVNTSGYYQAGDGGGGSYIYDAQSTLADNGGTVIKPAGVPSGRYLLQHNGMVSVRQFGARSTELDVTDQSIYFQAAHDAMAAVKGIVWVPPTATGTGFMLIQPLICRRTVRWRGVPNYSRLVTSDARLDHSGFFEQDMSHEEGRFYKHGTHTSWRWLHGLVLDMRGKTNGPMRARKLRRHYNYVTCSYLYIIGNQSQKHMALSWYHTDKSIITQATGLPSACFGYHNKDINVIVDDCYAPSSFEMLGLNFPGLGRLANNNTISGGRFTGYHTAVRIQGHDNQLIDVTTNPTSNVLQTPIMMDESDFHYRGKSGATFSDATPNGHHTRFDFSRGRNNTIDSNWVEQADETVFALVDNANTSRLSGLTVWPSSTALEFPEQIMDIVRPPGDRAAQNGNATNQIVIKDAAGNDVNEQDNYPAGAGVVVHSFDPDRRDGTDMAGDQFDGHSFTTITASVFSGGKTIITLADNVADQWTCGVERQDIAARVDDTTLTIHGDWRVQYAVGERIVYHKPNHGVASSNIVSRSYDAGTGKTTIVCTTPIVTEPGGVAYATYSYNRNTIMYGNGIHFPRTDHQEVVSEKITSRHFINGAESGPEACTIKSGALTITSGNLTILPESGTTDNLDKITGLNDDGTIIHLRPDNAPTNTITVRHATGGSNSIYTNTGASVVLSAAHHEIILRYNASMVRWVQIGGNTS